jgi:L-rhamnose mutarotase
MIYYPKRRCQLFYIERYTIPTDKGETRFENDDARGIADRDEVSKWQLTMKEIGRTSRSSAGVWSMLPNVFAKPVESR